MSTLDSLLGSSTDTEPPSDRDPGMVEWWRIRPRQSAPPRTTSSGPSPGGRFIANEEMLQNEVRAGRKTQDGQALALPKVTPYVSYGMALVNAAVYGTVVRVAASQGADAAAELLAGVGLSREGLLEQGEAWRLLTGCFAQADLAPLALVLYGLLVVAPRVEASLGYRTFLAAYFLPALVAADVTVALSGALPPAPAPPPADLAAAAAAAVSNNAAGAATALDAVLHPAGQALTSAAAAAGLGAGGLGAVMGIAGCAVAHQWVNGEVERMASTSSGGGDAGASTSSTSGKGGSGGGSGGGWAAAAAAEPRGVLLAAGGAAVVLQTAFGGGAGGGGAAAALAAALGASFATGFLLAVTAGPRYQVTREVELPDGSMWIPDPDAVQEVTVVLDQTTAIQRSLATGGLGVLVALGSAGLLAA